MAVSCHRAVAMDAMKRLDLDNSDVLQGFLPDGWQEQAKHLGALQRSRKVKDAKALLCLLLIHVAGDHSLRETAWRAQHAGLCEMSNVAVMLRLRSASAWLGWMVSELARQRVAALPAAIFEQGPAPVRGGCDGLARARRHGQCVAHSLPAGLARAGLHRPTGDRAGNRSVAAQV